MVSKRVISSADNNDLLRRDGGRKYDKLELTQKRRSNSKRLALGLFIGAALSIMTIPNSSAFTLNNGSRNLYELAGESIQNSIKDTGSLATGVEEFRMIKRNIGLAFGYVDEGTKYDHNRSGIFADLIFVNYNSSGIRSFIGIGPYLTNTVYIPPLEKKGYSHLDLSVLYGVNVKINDDLSIMAEWMQSKTFDNRDTDIIMGGIGIKFPYSGNFGLAHYYRERSATYILKGKSSYTYASAPSWEIIQTITPRGSNNGLEVGYINEGHKYANYNDINKRDGIFVGWWHSFRIGKYLTIFNSLGPYFSSTTYVTGVRYEQTDSSYIDKYNINLIAGAGLILKLPYKFNLITSLQYVYSGRYFEGHSTNSKIFSIGVGYRY